MNNVNINDLVTTVGIIVAAALALATALGPTVMYLTEALKKAFHVENGSGGLIALVLSVILTALLAVVTVTYTQDGADTGDYLLALGIGAFVGIFVGGGAVQSYKAAGSVNPSSDNFKAQFDALMAELNAEDNSLANAIAAVDYAPVESWYTMATSDDVDTEPSTADIMAAGPKG